jgi:hypothetical protein
MGLALNGTDGSIASGEITYGLMGVGPTAQEAPPGNYPDVIDSMKANDIIGVKAFSLWLNDVGRLCV